MMLRPMIIACAHSLTLPGGGLNQILGHLEEPGKAAGLQFWFVVLICQSKQFVQDDVRLEDRLFLAFFKGPEQGDKMA